MNKNKVYSSVQFPADSHTMPDSPVYTVLFWIPSIKHSNMPPLLMKPTPLTNISPHTLNTRTVSNNTSMLIVYINGDIQSVSNDQMLFVTK